MNLIALGGTGTSDSTWHLESCGWLRNEGYFNYEMNSAVDAAIVWGNLNSFSPLVVLMALMADAAAAAVEWVLPFI